MVKNESKSSTETTGFGKPRAFDTILYGGLAVGLLDGLFALTFYELIMDAKPLRIFQSVAAGLLGRAAAHEGGIKTFLLGTLLHFVVATCIAAVYHLASRLLPLLIRHEIISGLIYGPIAYLAMNYVVIPLSAIRRSPGPKRLPVFLTEIIGHALLVGLPIALLARRSAKAKKGERKPIQQINRNQNVKPWNRKSDSKQVTVVFDELKRNEKNDQQENARGHCHHFFPRGSGRCCSEQYRSYRSPVGSKEASGEFAQ